MKITKDAFSVCLLGFGQVGRVFAERLVAHLASISVYSADFDRPGGLDRLRTQAGNESIRFLSLGDAIAGADVVLSVVPPGSAFEAAKGALHYLRKEALFIDLTSVGPRTKREVCALVSDAGKRFIEGVILEAVATAGARTRILLCGPDATAVAPLLQACGLNAVVFPGDVGRAARLKMLRGIWSKGFEAILLEALVTASRSGLENELWETVEEFVRGDVGAAVRNWILSHPLACSRRADEMHHIMETVVEAGIPPTVSSAVLSFFSRSSAIRLGDAFGAAPNSVEAVARALEGRL